MIDEYPENGLDVRERYQKAMRLRVHHLTGRVLDMLKQAEHAYRSSGTIPQQEPPQWIARSIDRALDAVTLPPAEMAATLDMPDRTGTRRGRQGVPERALLRAYHLGGRELSVASAQWAMEEGVDHRDVAPLIDAIWRVTEEHSSAAVAALRGAREEIVEPSRAGHLLDALLNGDEESRTVAAVARSFAVPETGRYAVVVRHPAHGGVREEDLVPFARGTRLVWRRHGVTAVGVAVLGTAAATSLAGALPAAGGYRTGVSGAMEGLASLGRARQGAEAAARTLRGPGLAFLEERFPAAMLHADPGLARQFQAQVLAPVLALDAGRRDALLETLEAWLRAGGSAGRVADDLFCHRNTVQNRLRRLEELTGRSLSAPTDVIDLGLAVQAFRQFGDEPPGRAG
ncbi:CdaR family transcriptional regulator [Actinomadura sp. WMMB 499]|uniref:PucR family transcriptional regulator n=1 Tax=Actinomadura sp. WMMB 499 TaxID=1219491 RepID=UPI001248A517|nr:PucR family transcriptional regulator [Actinomadura sp. WMMB 499]QFG24938.1 PucR family transcriptional regulator [Actinomadura sp. WMMB 499]